jgi:hypothetical protein
MKPQERADWLNQFNQHKAKGGIVEFQNVHLYWCPVCYGPDWLSNPDHWRMVPLPRTTELYLVCRWTAEGLDWDMQNFKLEAVRQGTIVKTIEVTEDDHE